METVPSASIDDRYLAPKRVREIADLSNGAVYRLAHSGEVKVVRIGGCLRFSEASLRAYLARQTIAA